MGKAIVILAAGLCISQAAQGATWYVNAAVLESGDGRTPATAFKKIQEGIDAASSGDAVIVAEGTYVEKIHLDGKNITLTSTDPLDPSVVANTIIDGNKAGSVVTFSGTEIEACVLSGFTIRNGETSGSGGGICGGAYPTRTHATIQNNTISDNIAGYGGGLSECNGTIQNNTIAGNSAADWGGGLSGCDGTIQNNTISENRARYDGGGLRECAGTIQNNTITGNSATYWGGGLDECHGGGLYGCNGRIQNNTITGNSARDYGGGLFSCGGTIENNTITGNTAPYGGGLGACNGTIQNNTITGNSAGWIGGGLWACGGTIQNNTITGNSALVGGGLADCYGTIQNNTITGNSAVEYGGGLYHCNGMIRNNTITGNSTGYVGGLAWCGGTIRNCIIWGNAGPTGLQLFESSIPTYSCMEDWTGGGEGNIALNPQFVDPDGPDNDPQTFEDNDYRLLPNSPCVDAGKNEDWMWSVVDLDGNARIVNGTVDMGAYEYVCLGGSTWYVKGSAAASGDGRTWQTAFKTIQEGVNRASSGDTVIVAEGTYVENIQFFGEDIVLRSTDPLDPSVVASTIIDGNNLSSVVTFSGTETEACVLSGFTIRNGDALFGGGICGGTESDHTHATIQNNTITGNSAQGYEETVGRGGGLYDCEGTIQNNTITGNSAQWGGGLSECDGTIQNNTITGNSAEYDGGGLGGCSGTVQNNTITGNSAGEYAGGLSECSGTIQNNTITGNEAGWDGGALAWSSGTIQNNTITGNEAEWNGGGLIWCSGAIQNNTITGNSAGNGGALVRCHGTVQNNTIRGNSAPWGGGLYQCDGTIQNNTITGNSAQWGGGLGECSGTIQNCIIWGNAGPTGLQLWESSVPTYSCIQDWTGGGDGNIAGDPKFLDADGPDDDPATYEDNNYRLSPQSPCIDTGLNEDWMLDATDLDANPRVANGKVDMGAFEFQGGLRCIITAEGDVVTLEWGDFGNGSYTVEWRDDLIQGMWQPASGNWPISELMWNDILTKQMMQRFYRVESAGIYTNPVGFMRVLAVDAGLTVLSVPLAPADNRLNGEPGCIGDMLKEALTGGASAGEADMVFKWSPRTQTFRKAYVVAGVGPGLDGKWWDEETGALSTMTLDVAECFWVLMRSRPRASP